MIREEKHTAQVSRKIKFWSTAVTSDEQRMSELLRSFPLVVPHVIRSLDAKAKSHMNPKLTVVHPMKIKTEESS